MDSRDFMVVVLTGCLLIVFGLVPGLFLGLTAGVRNLLESFSQPFPMRPPQQQVHDQTRQPFWLAGLGVALIVVSVLAYVSN